MSTSHRRHHIDITFCNHKHRKEDTELIRLYNYVQQLLEIKHVRYNVLRVVLSFSPLTLPQYNHEQLREGSYLSLSYSSHASSLTAFSFVKRSSSLLFDLALELGAEMDIPQIRKTEIKRFEWI